MSKNVGGLDRILRLTLGVALILLPLATGFAAGTPWLRWGALAVGIVMVATATLRFCPLYTLIGANTCPRA